MSDQFARKPTPLPERQGILEITHRHPEPYEHPSALASDCHSGQSALLTRAVAHAVARRETCRSALVSARIDASFGVAPRLRRARSSSLDCWRIGSRNARSGWLLSPLLQGLQDEPPRRQPMLADSLGGYEAAIGATADIVCNPFSERVVIRRRPSAIDLEPGMRIADRLGASQFHEPIMPIRGRPCRFGDLPMPK